MLQHLYVHNTIYINAPAGKVWDVLTKPEETKKYMFGCETVSDWQPGSSLLWQCHFDGKDIVAVKGTIVSIAPGKELVYTVFDPNSTMPDVPENHLEVTYHLAEKDGGTILSVRQGNFATVAEGQKRYKDTYNNGQGWMPILEQIKAQAEAK